MAPSRTPLAFSALARWSRRSPRSRIVGGLFRPVVAREARHRRARRLLAGPRSPRSRAAARGRLLPAEQPPPCVLASTLTATRDAARREVAVGRRCERRHAYRTRDMLRAQASQAGHLTGWPGDLSDDGIGVALGAVHADVAHRWTVRELAEITHMLRSAFAASFMSKVGAAPLLPDRVADEPYPRRPSPRNTIDFRVLRSRRDTNPSVLSGARFAGWSNSLPTSFATSHVAGSI